MMTLGGATFTHSGRDGAGEGRDIKASLMEGG